MSVTDARRNHYNKIKNKTNAILNKYKHYMFFDNVFRQLNNPAFYINEDIMDEIKRHDTNGYVVDMHDFAELHRMEEFFNNMRKWSDDDTAAILPDNHCAFLANLSDLLQAIKITDPHQFGKVKVVNRGGSKKRSKRRSNRRSKKSRSRRTTSHRRRSRARR